MKMYINICCIHLTYVQYFVFPAYLINLQEINYHHKDSVRNMCKFIITATNNIAAEQ